jgi:YidC/Oxa1 family membrane protein insertase
MLLAVALSFAAFVLYGMWAGKNAKPAQQQAPAQQTQQPAGTPAPSGPAAAPPVAVVPTAPRPAPSEEEKTVALSGEGFQATFSTWGGALKSLTLEGKQYQRDEGGKTVPVDLVRVTAGQAYPLALAVTPEGGNAGDAAASARAPMAIAAQDAKSVTFTGSVGGLEVRKTFRVTGKPYELAMEVETSGGKGGTVAVLYPTFTPPTAPSHSFFLFQFLTAPSLDISQPMCRAGESSAERYDPKPGEKPKDVQGAVSWIAGDQHYFIGALVPAEPGGSCVLASGSTKGEGVAALVLPLEKARKASFTLYGGPKELDSLRAYGHGLDTSLNYGTARFFAVFARGLLYVMRWLQAFVSNWGVAIILLTLLVKVVLFPLTYKQMQSMNEMRKLQPEIEKLKAKHGDDREKLNMAVMKLYQEHKVNPLGGCLPMLLQMPIWFALYAALQTSVELYRQQFLWIHDLTQRDPYFILPLAMGVSSFIMQKLSPQPTESGQAKMMLYFFPIFFTFIMLNVPAGLTLYIFVNNVLSIAQQQLMMKKQTAAVAPAKG